MEEGIGMNKSKRLLQSLQHTTGLVSAAASDTTGYDKSWIRDTLYISFGYEAVQDIARLKKAHRALLNVFKKHEYKIDHAIREKPQHAYQYIHARYHPTKLTEFHEEWGNKQNDAVGFFLFNVGRLQKKGIKVIRNKDDRRIIQKLVHYLESIEYWQDKDNGIWEENEEVHASSVGACVAGLKAVQNLVSVPEELIQKRKECIERTSSS